MKTVCVTGGIGSGKSLICRIFSSLGIPVYNADEAAHSLYEKYPEIIQKISDEISAAAVDKSGKIIRKKLREVVFSSAEKLKALNEIVHPYVKADFEDWRNRNKGAAYVIKEAAILFESGAYKFCDIIITVTAPVELRIERIKQRDQKSRGEIEKIMEHQLDEETLTGKSDFVIVNDETQLVLPQVLKIHALLQK